MEVQRKKIETLLSDRFIKDDEYVDHKVTEIAVIQKLMEYEQFDYDDDFNFIYKDLFEFVIDELWECYEWTNYYTSYVTLNFPPLLSMEDNTPFIKLNLKFMEILNSHIAMIKKTKESINSAMDDRINKMSNLVESEYRQDCADNLFLHDDKLRRELLFACEYIKFLYIFVRNFIKTNDVKITHTPNTTSLASTMMM